MHNRNRVMIIEHDGCSRRTLCDVAEEAGFVVAEIGSMSEVIPTLTEFRPTVVSLGLAMPDADGIEYLRALAKARCAAPVIVSGEVEAKILAAIEHVGRSFGLSMHRTIGQSLEPGLFHEALSEVELPEEEEDAWCPRELEIRNAIANGDLLAFFQPRMNLQHHDFPHVGTEAVMRWRHPEHGMVAAEDFSATAARSGLIGPLTETVLIFVIQQLARWKNVGLGLPVTIDISALQFDEKALPERITRMIAEADLEPDLLHLEISESAASKQLDAVSVSLTQFRLNGISVGLRSYRGQHLSPSELCNLPLSAIKLDRHLVNGIERDNDVQMAARATIAMARELNVTIRAEGIDTAPVAHLLQSFDCDEGAGFFFGKPQHAEQFTSYMQQRRLRNETNPGGSFPITI